MKIILDAFGGDNAPLSNIKGAALAVQEYGVDVVLVGDEQKIKACIAQNGVADKGFSYLHAPDVIAMDDDATDVLKKKPNSSMAVALKTLAEGGGDAVVSAGSTGALLVGATLIVKRIKGVKRPALGVIIPAKNKPYLLIDNGANVECRPEMLLQFAVMGSVYVEKVLGRKNPTVALANVGAEETKGGELQLETYKLLKESGLNFTGNIEGKEIALGEADVVVADGFTGNIILKVTEGVAKFLTGELKAMFKSSFKSKMAYLLIKSGMGKFAKMLDASEHGGAPLLGVAQPVIKAHGSSNDVAIKNAIRQAKTFIEKDCINAIEQNL